MDDGVGQAAGDQVLFRLALPDEDVAATQRVQAIGLVCAAHGGDYDHVLDSCCLRRLYLGDLPLVVDLLRHLSLRVEERGRPGRCIGLLGSHLWHPASGDNHCLGAFEGCLQLLLGIRRRNVNDDDLICWHARALQLVCAFLRANNGRDGELLRLLQQPLHRKTASSAAAAGHRHLHAGHNSEGAPAASASVCRACGSLRGAAGRQTHPV
mmetsp:Transcript_10673/g.32068  ORF Transcript_10673/g.32068 Transcript_10673/m.32068 type:complete len:210 (-) Transcript_10673:219-848(-)